MKPKKIKEVAAVEDQRVTIPDVSNITPKPTKTDIRRAMAMAIRERQQKARDEAEEKEENERKEWESKALVLLKENGKWEEPTCYGDEIRCYVTFQGAHPKAAKLYSEAKERYRSKLPYVQEIRDIEKELIEAERVGRGTPVESLLADEGVKAALLSAAERLLAGSGTARHGSLTV